MSNNNEQNEQNEQKSDGAYADEIIQGHSYDGIQEYDNPMPLWWKAVFALTVIWSPIYIGLLEMGYIDTYDESLHAEDTYWENKIAEMKKAEPELTPEKIKAEFDNAERVGAGKAVFAANCAACHGDHGQGVIGPNLTDKFWLHGGDENSIFHTITTGVLDKGMPAWGSVLSQNDVLNVGAFIHSLKNTNVPDGKAPQGEPYVEDGAAGGDAGGDAAGDAAAKGEDDAAKEGGDDAAAKEGGDDAAAKEGGDDAAAKEGGDDAAAKEGGDDAAAKEGGDDAAAKEGAADAK